MKNKKSGKLVNYLLWLLIIATFLLFLNYIVFDSFYFKCIFRTLTGFDCPTCGMQRSIIALFSGEINKAFWHNPYLTLMLPYFATLILTSFLNWDIVQNAKKILSHPITIATLVILMIAWWMIRNLSFWKEFTETQITSM